MSDQIEGLSAISVFNKANESPTLSMTRERVGELYMLGVAVFEGALPILGAVAVSLIGPLHAYLYSLIFALLCFFLYRGLSKRDVHKSGYSAVLLKLSIWSLILYSLFFLGLQRTSAGNAAILIFTQVFFSFLYFNVITGERLGTAKLMGAILMTMGVGIILTPGEFSVNTGDFLVLLAAAVAPFVSYYQKLARGQYSPSIIMIYRTASAIPVVAILAVWLEPQITFQELSAALPYIVLIGVLALGISKVMWIEALHRISVTKASAMAGLVPVVSLVMAFLILGEAPDVSALIGILVVLSGGYLITRPT